MNKRYPITYELVPPRGINTKSIDTIIPISHLLEAITVTDNPIGNLRVSAMAYANVASSKINTPIIPNVSCRDRNILAIQSDVLGACLQGRKSVYVISGDITKDHTNFKGVWEVNSIELCKILKKLSIDNNLDLSIGGAIIFGRPSELETYSKKIIAGFDYFITQIIYEQVYVENFYAEAEDNGTPINKHIQLGLSPAGTLKKFHNISQMTGIYVPIQVKERLENTNDYQGEMLSILLELVDDLKSNLSGYSIGFHVMPIGSDELAIKLVEELK